MKRAVHSFFFFVRPFFFLFFLIDFFGYQNLESLEEWLPQERALSMHHTASLYIRLSIYSSRSCMRAFPLSLSFSSPFPYSFLSCPLACPPTALARSSSLYLNLPHPHGFPKPTGKVLDKILKAIRAGASPRYM